MKRNLLLFVTSLCIPIFVSGQVLQAEDFSTLPVGAVGTDATGTIPTNNYFTLSTNYDLDPLAATTATNAGPGNFQIVDLGGEHGNVLQIEGTNGDKGRRNMWQGGLGDQWAFRDPANNRFQVDFDLYTGAGGGESNNTKGLYIYDATTTSTGLKILGGYVFNPKTLILQGIAYFTSATAPIGNYGFFLGTGGTNIVLPANQWVRLTVSFNKTNGQVVWKGPSFLGQVTGAASGVDPDKVTFISRSGSAAATATTPAIVNAAATTAGFFDNLLVAATNVDLLAVDEVSMIPATVSCYPNPMKDFVEITSTVGSIQNIELTDLNGRVIKSASFTNLSEVRWNTNELTTGVYFFKIVTSEGTFTRKMIKN